MSGDLSGLSDSGSFNWQDVENAMRVGKDGLHSAVDLTRNDQLLRTDSSLPPVSFGSAQLDGGMAKFIAPPVSDFKHSHQATTDSPAASSPGPTQLLESRPAAAPDQATAYSSAREIQQTAAPVVESPAARLESEIATTATSVLADTTPRPAPRINSALARVIGNLATKAEITKIDATPVAPVLEKAKHLKAVPNSTDAAARRSIGLEVAPEISASDIGLQVEQPASDTAEDTPIQSRLETNEVAEESQPSEPFSPIEIPDAPFKFVTDSLESLRKTYEANDCRYSRTLRPDDTIVEVQTAPDFSSMTTLTNTDGSNSLTVHDRYRRPQFEQKTHKDGTWSFSELRYDDGQGRINPFPAEKLTVFSDGAMSKFRFTSMGQVEVKDDF